MFHDIALDIDINVDIGPHSMDKFNDSNKKKQKKKKRSWL